MSTFLDLGLQEPINKALTDLGYEKPTIIQEKAIPQIISSTEDLKAFAQTGIPSNLFSGSIPRVFPNSFITV